MSRLFYLNINGFYGTTEKDREKLKVGLDDDCCMKNAEGICKMIFNNGISEYDVLFFSEFAPNTPSGKWFSNYMDKQGYKLILPNAYDCVEDYYYSIVVAYVKSDFGVLKSEASPEGWLTWCELSVDNKNIVGIHSTRTVFLNDMKETIGENRYKGKDILIFGDTNVTEESEIKQKKLLSEIMESIGTEILDDEKKNTFRGIRKPDRVFSNTEILHFSVIDKFYINELSDHDALDIVM